MKKTRLGQHIFYADKYLNETDIPQYPKMHDIYCVELAARKPVQNDLGIPTIPRKKYKTQLMVLIPLGGRRFLGVGFRSKYVHFKYYIKGD